MRERHHEVHRGEDEEHDGDVEGDEAEPAEEGLYGAGAAVPEGEDVGLVLGCEAVGWGRGLRRRVVVVGGCWGLGGWLVCVVMCVGGERRWVALEGTVV